MKLESEGESSLCLFISSERRDSGCGFAQVSQTSIGSDPTTETNGGSGGCGGLTLPALPAKHQQHQQPLNGCHDATGLTSLNCEHFRFIDEDEDGDVSADDSGMVRESSQSGEEKRHLQRQEQVEVKDRVDESFVKSTDMNGGVAPRVIKGVLKKGKRSERKSKKNRVTFDEAVTLYSDDFEEAQYLALRSAAEINCAEVLYMFEPPIEYQDLLPFEPPAEYRDIVENNEVGPSDPSVTEVTVIPSQEVPNDVEVQKEEENIDWRISPQTDGGGVEVAESELAVTNDLEQQQQQQQQKIDPTEESEKLFERFLEAEREFDEDEELNRVFHVLENDLANDEKNGTFDDNFFKKLINLLSAVEGDVQVPEGDFFTTTDFTLNEEDLGRETEDDDQAPSRTLSEADSDCSVSSQDTIIVRLGDDERLCRQNSEIETVTENCVENSIQNERQTTPTNEICDEVFGEEQSNANVVSNIPDDTPAKIQSVKAPVPKLDQSSNISGDLSRQSSGEQPPPKDIVQDADDSTSSDSRSGEVEEDIKLDDIGYDEEDADDYDEECLRGMVRGNSKIRRIIKKNALQCPLFRGIEARRRQQAPGSKYPRPKSPPLSQESLVEQLKWLTTVDDKEVDNFAGSKPPDVILSTGSIPLNGSMPSSEDEFNVGSYRPPAHCPRHMVPQDGQNIQYHIQAGYPVPNPIRPWISSANHTQVPQQFQRPVYPAPRAIVRPMMSYVDERTATVPRDWRVVQRVVVSRDGNNYGPPAEFQRCVNGSVNAYKKVLPTQGHDELEQFVQQGSQRIERIRKRYSVAEEDDDPTFGFARRPSVRGVQSRLPHSDSQYQPSDLPLDPRLLPAYSTVENPVRGRNPPEMAWSLNASWRQSDPAPAYCASTLGPNRSAGPVPVHRASVALTELSGCATLPHPKTHSDSRYHSYAENMYSGSQTLPHKRWNSVDPRTCMVVGGAPVVQQQHPRLQGPAVAPPKLQVPQHPPVGRSSDERGVPEGASSSPKVSSDSLYHDPLQETASLKDDGVIYYSMNV